MKFWQGTENALAHTPASVTLLHTRDKQLLVIFDYRMEALERQSGLCRGVAIVAPYTSDAFSNVKGDEV